MRPRVERITEIKFTQVLWRSGNDEDLVNNCMKHINIQTSTHHTK
jgi:hypothetical protein